MKLTSYTNLCREELKKQPSDNNLQELERLIKCCPASTDTRPVLTTDLVNRKTGVKYEIWKLNENLSGLLLLLLLLLVCFLFVCFLTTPSSYQDEAREQHARATSEYSMEPDGVSNVIECAPGGRALFIVINSRAQNFERRVRLRTSWLNPANLRRELCHDNAGSAPNDSINNTNSHSPLQYAAVTSGPLPPNGPLTRSINQSNRLLAHKARIGRIEWLFALGHARRGVGGGAQDLGASSQTKEEKDHELILSRHQLERGQFNDLLMLPLVDSYRNMTLKHLAMFEWLLRHSGQRDTIGTPSLLIKADDDAQLDLAQIISKYVIETSQHHHHHHHHHQHNHQLRKVDSDGPSTNNLIMCARFEPGSPVARPPSVGGNQTNLTSGDKLRTTNNKWALTRREWPHNTFPAYCSGLAYLTTLNLIDRLNGQAQELRKSRGMPTLWIDDVYVTGVLLARLPRDSYRIVRLNSYFCYTRAQKLHRQSLEPGLKCMAYEDTTT